jgi:hypothetical protein
MWMINVAVVRGDLVGAEHLRVFVTGNVFRDPGLGKIDKEMRRERKQQYRPRDWEKRRASKGVREESIWPETWKPRDVFIQG